MNRQKGSRPGCGTRAAEETTRWFRAHRNPPCRLCPLCACGYRNCRENALTLAVVDVLRGGRR